MALASVGVRRPLGDVARPAARRNGVAARTSRARRVVAAQPAAGSGGGGGGTTALAAPLVVAPGQTPTYGQYAHQHQQQPRSASGRVLNAPARLEAGGSSECRVRDAGGPVSLSTYMRLPIEQYYILDPSQIHFLESNRFLLSVPRINLLGAALEPRLEVAVEPRADAVVLRATRCQLRGSGPFSGLDEKFSMSFETVITWQGGAAGPAAAPSPPLSSAAAAPAAPAPRRGAMASLRSGLQQWRGEPGAGSGGGGGTLTGTATIEVACEVIPPFNLMPREMLEGSCNAVLGGLVRSLLPVFMRQLAADYKRWAADPAYRAARAARSKPLS